jgi:putative peptidoglycan lipid II flippase
VADGPAVTESNPSRRPVRVGRIGSLMAGGTLVSRILGFVRMLLLTYALGLSTNVYDSFNQANQIPNNLYELTIGGILTSVLVPQVVAAIRADDRGERYINKLVTLALTGFVVITAALIALTPLIIRAITSSGWGADRLSLTIAFAYWCVPQVLFYAIFALVSGIYNAHDLYLPAMWTPLINNVVTIVGIGVFIWLFGTDPYGHVPLSDWGPARVSLLAGTATLGVAVQAVLLLAWWRRLHLRFRLDFDFRGVGLRATVAAGVWIFGAVVFTQLQKLVTSFVLTTASNGRVDGDISIVSNGGFETMSLVYILPHSVIAVSLATIYFTRFSQDAADRDPAKLRGHLSVAARQVVLAMTLCAAVLVVVSPAVARLFTPAAGAPQAGLVLALLSLSLPVMSLVFVYTRALYALRRTRFVFLETLAKFVWLVPAFLLLQLLPAAAIAPAAALLSVPSMLFDAIVLGWELRRVTGSAGGGEISRLAGRMVIPLLGAVAVGVLLSWLLGIRSVDGFAMSGVLAAVVACLVAGAAMAAVFLGLGMAVRVPGVRELGTALARRVRR